MRFRVQGISSDEVRRFRSGEPDANGQAALRQVAQGGANPCRHCLQLIAEGDEMLVLAYRPFDSAQPYAEVGPIFLHANTCTRYQADRLPAWFANLQPALIRGYDHNDWIRYETGKVVAGTELPAACETLLAGADVAYLHIRSKFNCFQCRVDRS